LYKYPSVRWTLTCGVVVSHFHRRWMVVLSSQLLDFTVFELLPQPNFICLKVTKLKVNCGQLTCIVSVKHIACFWAINNCVFSANSSLKNLSKWFWVENRYLIICKSKSDYTDAIMTSNPSIWSENPTLDFGVGVVILYAYTLIIL
jgi:hypothetical protein